MQLDTKANVLPLATVARIALAALFIVSGVSKAFAFDGVAGWIGHVGLPLPKLVLAATLVLEIGGGLLLAIGWRARLLAVVFALFTLLAALLFHPFWSAAPEAFDNELTHFLKNVALVGGLLALAQLERRHERGLPTRAAFGVEP